MPSALFKSTVAQDWLDALESSQECVKAATNPKFEALDAWVNGDGTKNLPALLHKQRCITAAQLSKLMQFKLLRGKWRPRLQMFVDGLKPELVRETSAEAFDILKSEPDKLKAAAAAVKVLAKKEMKGVGPAMASLILSVFDSSIPFMGDEALVAVLGSRDYDVRTFLAFAQKLQTKADALNVKAPTNTPAAFNCRLLERALWCEAVTAGTQRGTAFRKLKGGGVRKKPQQQPASAVKATSTRRKRKAPTSAAAR